MKRKYGDMSACMRCTQDVQWLGRASGWRDRGNNRTCCAYILKGEVIRPKGQHTVRELKVSAI